MPTKTPGKNGFKYKPKWGVIVICKDEQKQKSTYAKLARMGYRCKVVTV
ncbi:hypothetical protein [Agarivorans sp. B2Z047]|nr:hypothetical protein [Agarivorans sp. B2Z047]UQN42333.1 hypothetical protein LQZ07_21560 [Agarivorans sp. B2Z047]